MRTITGTTEVSRWSAGCLSTGGKKFSGRGKTFTINDKLAVQLEADIEGDFNAGTFEMYGCTYTDD